MMTEKRYSLVYYADKGGAFIRDNKNSIEWYHDSRASLLEIVDKLNELAEENTQLKNKLKFLNELNKPYGTIIEENQRLKAFIKSLCDKNNEIWLDDGSVYRLRKVFKGEWVK